ncbi:class I SAM-dependent methyltransferase [Patescibacteria group bacterium]|nr:class I SAM-dependent methyltransferase [Patescibacteria group bacterium]
MIKKSFDKNWEENIYSKGKHLNKYPYDILVSIVAHNFFDVLKNKRNKIRVLDLGCGAGNNTKFLAENGFDVWGIDGSKSAIEKCREKFKTLNLKGNFIQGDFLNLPYSNNFFDLVVDRESLYANKFSDIKNIVDEIYKKMKRNGLFISFIYSFYHPERKLGEEIEPNTYTNFRKGSFFNTGKVHFINLKEIYELYSKFKIKNIMRHSVTEVHNKPQRLMAFDEYVIITRK